ncbi:MAG TPA: GTPase [Planctomycetota bacterium]|nr:GTPase [Planctomycetota bacterium]
MSARLRELTPHGSGGVSVLELEGERALELLALALRDVALVPGKLALVRLALGGEELDEALVWCESASRVELHLHGSVPLVERVTEELARAGFERWNATGLRTLEERALDALAHARAPAAARMLLDQGEGALRAELAACARLRGPALGERLELLRLRARRARCLLSPPRIVLAGAVNAGKSTLFNALVGSERALVSAEPGTTRDVLAEPARMGEWPVIVVDTAGERALRPSDAAAAIEAGGQALGRRARADAELVLWLCPADRAVVEVPAGAVAITTRADLAPASDRVGASGRASIAAGPDPLGAARVVARVVREALDLPERAWEAGVGVPFEAWMEPRLELAARTGDAAVLEELARAR